MEEGEAALDALPLASEGVLEEDREGEGVFEGEGRAGVREGGKEDEKEGEAVPEGVAGPRKLRVGAKEEVGAGDTVPNALLLMLLPASPPGGEREGERVVAEEGVKWSRGVEVGPPSPAPPAPPVVPLTVGVPWAVEERVPLPGGGEGVVEGLGVEVRVGSFGEREGEVEGVLEGPEPPLLMVGERVGVSVELGLTFPLALVLVVEEVEGEEVPPPAPPLVPVGAKALPLAVRVPPKGGEAVGLELPPPPPPPAAGVGVGGASLGVAVAVPTMKLGVPVGRRGVGVRRGVEVPPPPPPSR